MKSALSYVQYHRTCFPLLLLISTVSNSPRTVIFITQTIGNFLKPINAFDRPLLPSGPHSPYTPDMQTLFHDIDSQSDTTHLPTYTCVEGMTQRIQNLHLSGLLNYDDNVSSTNDPNDIDISCMLPSVANNDYDIVSPLIIRELRSYIQRRENNRIDKKHSYKARRPSYMYIIYTQ